MTIRDAQALRSFLNENQTDKNTVSHQLLVANLFSKKT